MQVTIKQANMINAIAFSEYTPVNGDHPESLDQIDWIWADCVIESAEDKGTFTSLVNAGLAKHNGHSGSDACVTLTEKGFAVFQSFYNY